MSTQYGELQSQQASDQIFKTGLRLKWVLNNYSGFCTCFLPKMKLHCSTGSTIFALLVFSITNSTVILQNDMYVEIVADVLNPHLR